SSRNERSFFLAAASEGSALSSSRTFSASPAFTASTSSCTLDSVDALEVRLAQIGRVAGSAARLGAGVARVGVGERLLDARQHLELLDLFVGKLFFRHLFARLEPDRRRGEPDGAVARGPDVRGRLRDRLFVLGLAHVEPRSHGRALAVKRDLAELARERDLQID